MHAKALNKYLLDEEFWAQVPTYHGFSDSVSCSTELQVVTQPGDFREHLKSITGAEEPVKMSSFVYVGVEVGGGTEVEVVGTAQMVSGLCTGP